MVANKIEMKTGNRSTYGEAATPDGKPSNVPDSLAHRQPEDDVGVVVRLEDWRISATVEHENEWREKEIEGNKSVHET